MTADELRTLVRQEISKAKLAGEDMTKCEANIVETLKTVTPPDEHRPTTISEAVTILWEEWDG